MPSWRNCEVKVTVSHRSAYHFLGLVGRGQYAKVFCAIHRATGAVVAVKEIDPARSVTAAFLRELRLLVTLQHPNVVAWQGYHPGPSGRYLVMDYCEGGTLRQLMQRPVPIDQAVAIVADILRGLAHVHGRGIIHADVKPENILLRLAAGGWQASLADFGIACWEAEAAQLDSLCGSLAYMAPERFGGELGQAADLYAIGIVLYELLVGDRPFSGTPADLEIAHLTALIDLPTHLPIALQQFLRQALSKSPADRFADAEAMLLALKPFLAVAPVVMPVRLPRPQSIDLDRGYQLQLTPHPDHPITQWRLYDRRTTSLAKFQTMTQFQTVTATDRPHTLRAIEVGGRELTIGLRPLSVGIP
jgi:serine/threonine protein kinase